MVPPRKRAQNAETSITKEHGGQPGQVAFGLPDKSLRPRIGLTEPVSPSPGQAVITRVGLYQLSGIVVRQAC